MQFDRQDTNLVPYLVLNNKYYQMKNITIQDIKRYGSKALPTSEVAYLIVNSRPRSAILPIDEYEMLIDALEELEDIRTIDERKNERTITLDEAFNKKRK